MSMQALRIDWTFSTPVVIHSNHLQHLDALVAFGICEEARLLGAPDAVALSQDLSHVFDRVQGVWTASAVQYTPASETFVATLVRRTDPEAYMEIQDRGLLLGRERKHIELTRGPDRNYFVFHPYQWMASASAWCIADEEELRHALEPVKALGKMTRNGFGRIRDMQINVDDAATDRWKIRVLPVDLDGCSEVTYIPVQAPLSPPYWDRTMRVSAREPVLD